MLICILYKIYAATATSSVVVTETCSSNSSMRPMLAAGCEDMLTERIGSGPLQVRQVKNKVESDIKVKGWYERKVRPRHPTPVTIGLCSVIQYLFRRGNHPRIKPGTESHSLEVVKQDREETGLDTYGQLGN
jgi:hypothetical protein